MAATDRAHQLKLVRNALQSYPTEKYLVVEDGSTGTVVKVVGPPRENLRQLAAREGLPSLEDDGFFAVAGYDSGTDLNTYRIERK